MKGIYPVVCSFQAEIRSGRTDFERINFMLLGNYVYGLQVQTKKDRKHGYEFQWFHSAIIFSAISFEKPGSCRDVSGDVT